MIFVRLSGGMGNQMFQYALGKALSVKHGIPLKLDLSLLEDRTPRPESWNFVFRNYDLDIFNIDVDIANRKDIPHKYRFYGSGMLKLALDSLRRKLLPNPGLEKSFSFDPNVLSLGKDSYLEGYWQSPKYFDSIESLIRKEFTLKDPFSEKFQKLSTEIRSHESVCINVRRADFVTSDFHGTFGSEYYQKGVDHVARHKKIDHIYIFSDDVEWCRKNLSFGYPATVVGHEYAGKKFGEYLYLMAACKNFVIPNSSFAWWGAWLNSDSEKIVIVPKNWFLDESITTNDLIPEGWIRI